MLGLLGCQAGSPADESSAADVDTTEPVYDAAEWYTFEAGPFTVPAGEERFFCYSFVLEEDLWVDNIVLESRPVVHHLLHSVTRTPDPEGFFECDALFQNNWIPIFVAGTGDAAMAMPEGAGHILEKGTQLTMQLHLLNATPEEVTETVPLHFHKMATEPEYPVEMVIFGNMSIALPPGEESEVIGNCDSDSDMTIFSAFPHMHLLGRSMVVEAGPDEDSLVEVFRRDPYDFDDQFLSPMELSINEGDRVRVTCSYDNHHDEMVTFGESTTNEMCFFIGFATQATHQLAGCIGGGGNSFLPETCGDDPPNDIGLGAFCSKGGGECESGLMCTEDLEYTEGLDICLGFGCSSQADCGEGGICCSLDMGMPITLCLPPSCSFGLCEELD
tara:strand:- start:1326 stop:2486 length:1161 start_codon:yes stop_codon:yes gene_type:complete